MAILEAPEKIVPESLPYPIRGGLIRGLRTGIAFVLAGVVASVADGSLLGAVKIVPVEYAPFVTGALGVILVSVDKWLREKGLIDKAAEDAAGLELGENVPVDEPEVPTTGPVGSTTDDVPAEGPLDDGVDPDVFDDDVPVDNL